MNNSKRIYRAAIYVRLSKEDGDLDDVRKAESNSISNQKSLILNYLKDKEDIEIVSIREDDGYSGATFDRPAFKLMMQDVKDGILPIKMSGMFLKIIILHLSQRNSSMRCRRTKER